MMSQSPHITGEKAAALIARDSRVMSTSNTRPYPLAIDHARGAEVWDVDGRRYIDFMAGIAVTSTGHCHPQVVQAIKAQADRFLHICLSDFYFDVAVELAEKLNEIAPFKENAKMFFTNSGTEAIEAAMKLARYHTGRPNLIAFHGAFHGRTMGALSLTGSKYVQKKGFAPFVPGVTHVPYPNEYHPVINKGRFSDYGEAVVSYIEKVVFATHVPASSVAAIFVEPIQGEGGYVVPPPGFFPALRDLCDRHGILLVVDEIQSGIGRTGKWWAVEHFGVEPDIFTTSKGLASGMPLGAMVARESVMTWQPGSHGSTFGGNPLACAAAVATLKLVEEGYMQNAAEMGQYMMDALGEMLPRHPILDHVRGKGLMIGVEIVDHHDSRTPSQALRDQVVAAAFERGLLLLGAGNTALRLIPPLMIDKRLMDEGLQILDDALTAVERRL
ncbi:MAG: acetyl ornithine aminotransferase family protein [Anaerolineae bacterium]